MSTKVSHEWTNHTARELKLTAELKATIATVDATITTARAEIAAQVERDAVIRTSDIERSDQNETKGNNILDTQN